MVYVYYSFLMHLSANGHLCCFHNKCFQRLLYRRLLRVPRTARRSNQWILMGVSPEYSLEGLILKLNLHYFGHLMKRADSLEKTLMVGKLEGRRKWGWQRMRCLDGITDLMDMSLSKLQKLVKNREARQAAVNWVTELGMTEGLNWSEPSFLEKLPYNNINAI